MAGGRGSRLGAGEKPLLEIDGVPMIDRVLRAVEESDVDRARVVTSPHTPQTAAHVRQPTIHTPGNGYVADLNRALSGVDRPVLTVTADLPLLTGAVIDDVLARAGTESTAVAVPRSLVRRVGATVDTTTTVEGRVVVPTGLNVVGTDRGRKHGGTRIMHDSALAINVNRPRDAWIAEARA